MSWGAPRRPKVSNKLGVPNRSEGGDGDIQIRQTNLGAKLFGKLGGIWYDAPFGFEGVTKFGAKLSDHLALTRESVDIYTDGVKVASFGETTTVKEVNLTGKITITSEGTRNVCMGTWSSGDPDTGSDNIAIGVDAGKSLNFHASNPAQGNIAIGSYALNTAATGGTLSDAILNIAIGNNAGGGITTGQRNTCVGGNTGTTAGSGATAITTGDFNTLIGAGASVNTADSQYRIAIGITPVATGDFGIAIGSGVTAGTEVVTIGKALDYITCDFGENATWSHAASDRRAKKDIIDNTLGLSFINDLKTVTFKRKPQSEYPEEFECYDAEATERKNPDNIHYGFIAQDVKEAMDKAGLDKFPAWKVSEAGCQSLGETEFITPLVKAVQELSAKIDTIQTEINNLKAE